MQPKGQSYPQLEMMLAFKTTLQLNSVPVEERGKRRTLLLDHCIHRVMYIPATEQGPKSLQEQLNTTSNFSNALSPSQLSSGRGFTLLGQREGIRVI